MTSGAELADEESAITRQPSGPFGSEPGNALLALSAGICDNLTARRGKYGRS